MLQDNLPKSAAHDSGREVLPINVKPTHYELTVEPNFHAFTYGGRVKIDLDVAEDTTCIVLNTVDLEILEVSVQQADTNVAISNPRVRQDIERQTTTFELGKTLLKGHDARLDVLFSGSLNDQMVGFHRSSYTTKDGSKKYIAATQLGPTDARRAFPCFDEPALKATFSVTLIADERLTCLSNMDVRSTSDLPHLSPKVRRQATHFNATPLMSTYLLALVVGELNFIEYSQFRIPVRVYATLDQEIKHGWFSAKLAVNTLEFYEEKFDSAFPLPKMDMLALPQFNGAMENWGLIIYRASMLLLDEENTGDAAKRTIIETVQHELAHQWFGNLVTMDFWEGLWLNEGFATWMSFFACNALFPDLKPWESFVTADLQRALSLDSLRSSHPVEIPVKRLSEIDQVFDSIAYSKGSSILRMIASFLGEDVFLDGVRLYLKKHAYGNAKTEDLWLALRNASGRNVQKVMQVWTEKVGYPVISIDEDVETNTIRVKQARFLATADAEPEENITLYPVILNIRTTDGIDKDLVLTDREHDFSLPSIEFFKINTDHVGMYRTLYSSHRLKQLTRQLYTGLLSTQDRAGILADAGALAASGYQPSSEVLNLLKCFVHERDYTVWEQLINWIASLREAWMFESSEICAALTKLELYLTSNKAHEMGWTPGLGKESEEFKAMMFFSAGMSGDSKIVATAEQRFRMFLRGDRSAIHPNLRGSVYAIVLQNGEGQVEAYNAILKEYQTSASLEERKTALGALGWAKDSTLVKRTISIAMDDKLPIQDIFEVIRNLRTHRTGVEALYAAMEEHWERFVQRLTGVSMLKSFVRFCTSGFSKPKQREMVEAFFLNRDTSGFDQGLAQNLDAIRVKSKWLARDGKDVQLWLEREGFYRATAK